MERIAAQYDPSEVEAATRGFWAERARRGDADGAPRRGGRAARLFVSALTPTDSAASTLYRAVRADAEARYLRLAGRRTETTLRLRSPWAGEPPEATVARLANAAAAVPTTPPETLAERRRFMLGHLADARIVVSRRLPLRVCPQCRAPRSPEGIVYESEPGRSYLVRFRLPEEEEPTSLLVWTDEVWKLLGTVALLVNPEVGYVVARWTRRGASERVIVSRSGLARLGDWLPGSEVDVLSEKLGAEFAGATYLHPLALEYPPLNELLPPGGTLVASNDVSDTGTGIVTLVPSHGAGDAAVARAHRIEGPVVVGTDGLIEAKRPHKYAGLELEPAESFILRDLSEGGALFAELSVERGVPRCAVCGTGLRWVPGRAWCLEPGRLGGESLGLFARLLPDGTVPLTSEVVPWTVSDAEESLEAADAVLAECTDCERLSTAPSGNRCACGGGFVSVRRHLVPAFAEAIDHWGSAAGLDSGDSIRLFVPSRRRTPALLHHLAAREAVDAVPADVRLVELPTLPETSFPDGGGEDALRAALLRSGVPPRGATAVADRARQERRRLGKFWALVARVLERSLADGFEPDASISSHLAELAEEDRAFLAAFERMRVAARASYEAGEFGEAQARLAGFAESELREGYLPMVEPRLAQPGLPPDKVAAYRVLHHVLPAWVELYAPVAPFAMEALHRALRSSSSSVFDRALAPGIDRALDSEIEADYDRWRSVQSALNLGRAQFGVPAAVPLPSAVLLVQDERVAARLRATSAVIARLCGVTQLIVSSPEQPWDGRRVDAHPVLPAIQKSFGAQSARVVRLLEQIPAKRILDGLRAGTLSVALEGRPMPILPGMVELTESLPDDVVPVPWGHGEILITLPPDAARHRRRVPALSLEGYRLLRHVERRLRRAGGIRPELLVISASAGLGEELVAHAAPVAEYLGVGQVAVNDGSVELPGAETTHGRTRRGEPWRVYIPGLRAPEVEPRAPRARRGAHRVPRLPPLRAEPETLEFLDQAVLSRETAIREIVDQVDRVLGRPVVGPAKVGLAFDAGFTTFDLLAHAKYSELVGVPGFGPVLTGELVGALGGEVPAFLPKRRPLIHRVGDTGDAEPASGSVAPPLPIAPAPAPLLAEPAVPAEVLPVAAPPPETLVPTPALVPASPVPVYLPAVVLPPPVAPSLPPRPRELPPLVLPGQEAVATAPPPVASPPASGVRLSLGDREDLAWRGFLDATSAGHRGLCLSREFPERRRALLGSRDVDIVWLSNVGKGAAVRPSDLPGLTTLITSALTDRYVEAVFLEGGEYLVRIHGVATVVAFLRRLDEAARERTARVWLPINPALMAAADLQALSEAVQVETALPE